MESPKEGRQIQQAKIESMKPLWQRYLSPSDVVPHIPALNENCRETIRTLEERGNRVLAVDLLLEEVKGSEDVTEQFLYALNSENYLRFDLSAPESGSGGPGTASDIESEHCALLVRFLQGELERVLDPSLLLPHLDPCLGNADRELLLTLQDQPIQACRKLFQVLSRRRSDWAVQFFETVRKVYGKWLVDKCDPAADLSAETEADEKEADEELDLCERKERDESRNATKGDLGAGNDDNDGAGANNDDSDDADDEILMSDEEKQDEEGTEKQFQPDEDPAKFDERMRSYQLELAQRAVEGRNVIICAPTGSGKTRVALYIVRKHMQQAAAQTRKVVFMARTVPLATQQYKAFKKHLPEFETLRLCGESDQSDQLHILLPDYDIVVLTPQVLVNHLEQNKLGSLSGHFSLLLLDECHHTRKEEAYNKLMRIYLKEKIKERRKNLPQVVGLTASLGVEKATDDQEAMEAITGVMANMDVLTIATVQQNKEELKKLVPVPEEKTEKMTARRNDPVKKEIEKVMQKLEDLLIDKYDFVDKDLQQILMKQETDRSSQKYGQWAVKLKTAIKKFRAEQPRLAVRAREFFVIAEHLAAYNSALEINELVRVQDALEFLTKKISRLPTSGDNGPPTETERQLDQEFTALTKILMRAQRNRELDNPNLKTLESKLAAMFEEKGDDSRGIIFVCTRASCAAMAAWLKEVTAEGLRDVHATAFTGTGATEDEGGMTQGEQENVIARFRAGEVKLLVATSVAEEGLDIPDCNIVIRYDHVGNEISTIQTRGRARKRGGTSLLFGGERTQRKEQLNIARAAMMERALVKVQHLSESTLKKKVELLQKMTLDQEEIKEIVRKAKTDSKTGGHFVLICCKCRRPVADSRNIVSIEKTHHVVIGKGFWNLVDIRTERKPKKFDGMCVEGRMLCNNQECHNMIGNTLRYQTVVFPALLVKSLTLVRDSGKLESFKRWLDVPYKVDEIRPEDFRVHLDLPDGEGEEELEEE